MNAILTVHAREQIEARKDGDILAYPSGKLIKHVTGVVTPSEVIEVVNAKIPQVKQVRGYEARVIVKILQSIVTCEDGSNGDVIVACVDPSTLKVKTVMLQRKSQVQRKQEKEQCYV